MSCGTTWTMLIQTSKSQQALAYRTQLRKKRQQEERQLFSLATWSNTIKNTLEDMPNTNIKDYFKNLTDTVTTQKTINALAQLYVDPMKNPIPASELKNKTTQELVDMINLATYLDMRKVPTMEDVVEPQEAVKQSLVNKIKSENLSELLPINILDLNKAAELMHDFIKQEKIDVKLVEPYQKKLPSEPIKLFLTITPNLNDSKLLFFDNDQFIYGSFYEDLESTLVYHCKKIISKNKLSQQETIIFDASQEPFRNKQAPSAKISPNGLYCLLTFEKASGRYNALSISYTYKLLNLKNKKLSDLPLSDYWQPSDYWQHSFVSDEIICALHRETKEIILFNISTQKKLKSYTPELEEDEYPSLMACKYTQSTNPILGIATNKRIIFIKDNKATDIPVDQSRRILELVLNDTGTTLFYVTIKEDDPKIFSCNIDQQEAIVEEVDPCHKENTTRTFVTSINTKNDNLLVATSWYHVAHRLRSAFSTNGYVFISPQSLTSWDKVLDPKTHFLCISNDGKQSVEQHTESKTTHLITLCDDNMTEALSYLDTTKPDPNNIPAQKKLLVTKLVYSLLNKPAGGLFNTITLDETESEIYTKDAPQCIKDILAKTYTIKLSDQTTNTSQQKTSLRNKILYGTAAVGTALGITAAYKWWAGNKE